MQAQVSFLFSNYQPNLANMNIFTTNVSKSTNESEDIRTRMNRAHPKSGRNVVISDPNSVVQLERLPLQGSTS